MITSKMDYKYYLEADKVALGIDLYPPFEQIIRRLIMKNWKYQRILRKAEYFSNCSKTIIGKIIGFYLSRYKLYTYGAKIGGFSVPINTCGPGLALMHLGTIIIHSDVIIGKKFSMSSDGKYWTQW